MQPKKLLLFGVSLLWLSVALPSQTNSLSGSNSISGSVMDQHAKPLSGVMITAFDSVEDKMITVFTKERGTFRLPGLSNRGYKLRARLPGFDDEFTSVALSSGSRAPVALRLKPATNPKMQETSVDRIRLIKWPTDQARLNFRMACVLLPSSRHRRLSRSQGKG